MAKANGKVSHIKDLRPDKRNPRLHPERNISSLEKSLEDYGAARSIVIDEKNNVIAGNGILEAAANVGIERVRTVEADGNEIIAVVRRGLTKQQKRGLSIADNRGAELSSWSPEILEELSKEIDLSKFWTDQELNDLLQTEPTEIDEGPEPQIDKADELQCKWKVSLGDIWKMGKHRLMCGDSNSPEDVSRLTGSIKYSALVFDPPWEIEYGKPTGEWESMLVFTDGRRLGESITMFGSPTWSFVWDCGACWFTPNRPLQSSKLCLWYGDLKKYDMNGSHYGDAGEAHKASNSRGSYWFVPDDRGKHLADIFKFSLVKLHNNGWHEHEKPLDWVRLLIGNCTEGTIFDPYSGSGTSFVASEQINRCCYGMEIEPRFVAVALERMSEMHLKIRKEKT
jgi:hypothetical protein